MEIRECTVSDSARICQINKDSLGYRYDLEKTKQRLEQIIGRPTDKLRIARS